MVAQRCTIGCMKSERDILDEHFEFPNSVFSNIFPHYEFSGDTSQKQCLAIQLVLVGQVVSFLIFQYLHFYAGLSPTQYTQRIRRFQRFRKAYKLLKAKDKVQPTKRFKFETILGNEWKKFLISGTGVEWAQHRTTRRKA